MSDTRLERALEITNTLSEPAILEQFAEECVELSQVALKMARKLRGENPTPKTIEDIRNDFREEYADVMNCVGVLFTLPQYETIFSSEWFLPILDQKRERWIERLKENTDDSRS